MSQATVVRPHAIHQFHASSSYGDGITNGMFFIQNILRNSGYHSEIFCRNVDPRFVGGIRPIESYPDLADDLLLVHYSMGTPQEAWIENRKSPRVLIYHNITPAHFFPDGSKLHGFAQSGRARLAAWAKQGVFAGAIGDSAFNAAELLALGYSSVAAIPLLVDLDRIRQAPWNPELLKRLSGARNLLFVGRLCENKGQLDLIKMLAQLTRTCAAPVRLILVGDTTSPDYQNLVVEEVERCGLSDRVLMAGKLDDRDVYALYRCCDLYCSMSQHEGFRHAAGRIDGFRPAGACHCHGCSVGNTWQRRPHHG